LHIDIDSFYHGIYLVREWGAMAMKRIEFRQPERWKQVLRREIRRNDDARYDHRLHAVLLALDDCSPYEVARLLGDAPRSIYNWIEQFRREGLDGLRDGARPGRNRRLTDPQLRKLAKDVLQSPTQWNYGQPIWDGPLLSYHVKETFGISLGVRQCQRLFGRLGMRLLRPRTMPQGADPQAQARFRKTDGLVERF
jgi:transposase